MTRKSVAAFTPDLASGPPQNPARLYPRRCPLAQPRGRLVAPLPQGRRRRPVLRRTTRDRTSHPPHNVPAQRSSPAFGMGKTSTTNSPPATPICVRRLRNPALGTGRCAGTWASAGALTAGSGGDLHVIPAAGVGKERPLSSPPGLRPGMNPAPPSLHHSSRNTPTRIQQIPPPVYFKYPGG